MDVYVDGKKTALTPADFRAQGGEGSVYVKNGMAYKVFTDPAKAVTPAKITELAVLSRPEILRPQAVLRDKAGTVVGYAMRSVPDAIPLCRTFTRAFRDKQGLTPEMMLRLVRALQAGVSHVHAQGVLLVDLNETNFLTNAAFDTLFFIDVDSYQTPHFPATALMDSVRDRHSAGFSTDTDWFAFAIVSFQMLIGIHPYKGKHPALKTLNARMQANISVLNPQVAVPPVCRPWDVLPPAYRDWYQCVLEDGLRCPPPAHAGLAWAAAPPQPRTGLSGQGVLDIEELDTFADDIVDYRQGLVITQAGVLYGGQARLHAGVQIGSLPHSHSPVAAWAEKGRIRFYDLARGFALAADIAGEAVFASDGRLYVKHEGALHEAEFTAFPSGVQVSLRLAASVMPHATILGEGIALQNIVGAWHATVPLARGRAFQAHLPELDGAQIVEAKCQGQVLMVSAAPQGRYDKFIFRFSDNQHYDVRTIVDVPTAGINFVVLSTGICLHLTDEGVLEVFPNRRDAGGLRTLTDPRLTADCRLLANGAQALFACGRTLHRFSGPSR